MFGTGTKTTTITPAGNGFSELKMEFTTGTGSTNNVVSIQAASADTIPIAGAETVPSIYVDLFQIVAA